MDWICWEREKEGVRMSQGARIMPFTEAEGLQEEERLHEASSVPTLQSVWFGCLRHPALVSGSLMANRRDTPPR